MAARGQIDTRLRFGWPCYWRLQGSVRLPFAA
jgi:hypothetical protein